MTSTRDRRTSLPTDDFLLQDKNVPSIRHSSTQRPSPSDPPAPVTLTYYSNTRAASPEAPRPAGIVQSAPATYPVTRHRSTPIKRKACSIPLSLLPIHGGSTGKRRRLASQVLPLLQEELHGRWFTYGNFLADFVHQGPWALSDSQAVYILALLSRDRQTKGIAYDSINDSYGCTPPGFADTVFPGWFCDLGNTILRMSQVNAGVDNSSTATGALRNVGTSIPMVGDCVSLGGPTAQGPNKHIEESSPGKKHLPLSLSTPGELSWVSCRTSALQGLGNLKPQARPDFVLTSNSVTPTWSTILVVGEHHSAGKTEESAKLQLASYVEQVFIAQPFRMAVIGILTSNKSTALSLWRFDRAGAVGSLKLNYSSTAGSGGLTSVVQCLYSLTTKQLHATWFHTRSIVEPTNEKHAAEGVLLREKIFTAGGIVSRGTCVWEGTLQATGRVVAVKYSWQSTKRSSEAKNYSVALSQGVVGLPELVSHDAYEDVSTSVRRGVIPCTLHDPHNPTPVEKSAVEAYTSFAMGCNRSFTRLVLGTIGRPISDSSLSPLDIARSLLAGVIAHASLFFQGGILHRDVSINNIIAITSPLATMPRTPPTIGSEFLYTPGTELYGCLIDLDYAVVVAEQDTSGIPERTGTYPFIAIAILRGTATHRYRHDLESFLYVLLWVACYPVAGTRSALQPAPPEDARQRDRWPPDDPLNAWGSESEAIVASLKTSNIVSDEDVFEELLERFRPGFDGFKLAAREMRLALWELHDTGICTVVNESRGTEEDTARAGQGRGRRKGKALGPEDVRIGVSNWEGFRGFRGILEELVHQLEREATRAREQREDDSPYN